MGVGGPVNRFDPLPPSVVLGDQLQKGTIRKMSYFITKMAMTKYKEFLLGWSVFRSSQLISFVDRKNWSKGKSF